jgi:hypothetical protein
MKWTFQLRGKDVTYTVVESAVAVRPDAALRQHLRTRTAMVSRFSAAAKDDSEGGKFGLALPSRNRRLFEKAGWLFVETREPLQQAALARGQHPDAQAVRQVLLDRSGGMLIQTDLATVQLDSGLSDPRALQILKRDKLKLVRRLNFAANTFQVRVADKRSLAEVIHDLQGKTTDYRFAEPDLIQPFKPRLKPSDPEYSRQWQLANDGSNGGVAGADIHAEKAWDKTLGKGPSRPVRIAVVDNGMQINHPDLKDGIAGGGYFDSDGAGGATFVPYSKGITGFPGGDHGTFCLGMAGARMNNKKGVCGSAPEADLLPIACFVDQVGTQSTLARAIAFAADPSREIAKAKPADGADVISCSLGPNGPDWALTTVLDLAIRFAAANGRGGLGVPIFWAVSNGSFEVDRDEVSSHPDVIAVGRSNRNDLEDGSAFGPELEFLAPGVEVYSTKSGSKYGIDTGCSFAAPLAAGVAALVIAANSALTRDQVRQRLRDSCDKVGGVVYNAQGHHDEYGYGRLNAERAVPPP